MHQNSQEIAVIIIAGTLLLLFLSTVLIFYVFIFQKRQAYYINETEKMKTAFENQLMKSQLEMQEQTFNSISQEIHDNVGQLLSLAKVQLNIINQSEIIDRDMLNDVKESIGKALADLRDIARSMNTERIRIVSLPETVGNELKRISRAGFAQASINIDGKEQNIPEQKKLIVFRIIQESLQNIIKHSKATAVKIDFCYGGTYLKIDIADNGTGFDMRKLSDKTTGLGLQNIISRAALIGGEAAINSIINGGTTVTIKTPYA